MSCVCVGCVIAHTEVNGFQFYISNYWLIDVGDNNYCSIYVHLIAQAAPIDEQNMCTQLLLFNLCAHAQAAQIDEQNMCNDCSVHTMHNMYVYLKKMGSMCTSD